MDKLSIYFNYDKKAKLAICKLLNVTPGGSSTSEDFQFVVYDLNKISVENAFKDFCERLDFYRHHLKTPKYSHYGKD